MKKITFVLLFLLCSVNIFAKSDLIVGAIADQICNISAKKNKSRLAIYTFTDSNDQETSFTRQYTAKVISKVLACGNIRVIDPTKIKEVMNEQSRGMLGIVDDETAAETGKLLGADALIFGEVDKKIVQIKIIDAATGEVLGMKVNDTDVNENPVITEENLNSKKAKVNFRRSQLRKQLEYLFRNRPGIFLLITSNADELALFRKKYPRRYRMITRRFDNSPQKKKEKFYRSKKLIMQLRKENPKFNRRIIRGHKKILSGRRGRR